MAWTASDFDATKPDIKVMSENMLGEHFDNEKYKSTAILKAMAEKQNVSMTPVMENGRCIGVKAFGLKDDDDVAVTSATDDNCDLAGNEVAVELETYLNNINLKASAKIMDVECPNLYTARDKFLYMKQRAILKLTKEIAKLYAPKIQLNVDLNTQLANLQTYYTGALKAVASDNTDLGEVMTDATIGHLYENAMLHDMGDDIQLISGQLLYQTQLMRTYEQEGCCNVKGVFDSDMFDFVFDIKNTDVVTSTKELYLVRNGAIFFYSNNRWGNSVPMEKDSKTEVWRELLPNHQYRNGSRLENIYLDVRKQRICEAGEYGTVYEWVFRGGLHTGRPNNDGFLGILGFEE